MRASVVAAVSIGVLASGWVGTAQQSGPAGTQSPLAQLVLPAGFTAEIFAENVPNAREMALGPQGTVFVGSRTAGLVHAVIDSNNDHKADRVVVIARGLDSPNGVAIRNGALYVATASRLLRFDDIEKHLDTPPAPVTVRADLPNPKAGHNWKFIAFGPDDLLYMSIGSTCNVCEAAPMTAAIIRMRPDGTNTEVFAEGVRNSVGFDWHPVTRELWFTDNGRDMLGDDVPHDELNIAPKAGLHFGWPFCHQGDVPDPEFGAARACSTAVAPVLNVGPHVAAVGMMFYTGSMFPASYRNAVIMAQHGSWNRSTPSGYRVMVAHTDGRRVTGFEPLVDNFLVGANGAAAPGGRGAGAAAIGRPADVLQLPDGSILISDDRSNRLIRVSYRAQSRSDVTINDTGTQAENLTSSQDGSIFFGSTAKGTIYRAAPNATRAEPWIPASAAGLTNVLGVFADDKSNTLWVCQNSTGGRGGAPTVGQTALRSFDLKSGAARGTYNFPSNGGVCNDIAVAGDGTVYATESFANRIHRLRPGAKELDVWVPADKELAGVDGIALLADGAVYVNTFFAGRLFRVRVNANGSAGPLEPIETSIPFTRPDGLRTVGPRTMLQAEGQGRLTEITINGNRAEVRVLREGLTAATGVTLVGGTAFVLVDRARGVGVPYQAK